MTNSSAGFFPLTGKPLYFDPIAIADNGYSPVLLVTGSRSRIIRFVEDIPDILQGPSGDSPSMLVDKCIIFGHEGRPWALERARVAFAARRMVVIVIDEDDPELRSVAYAILGLPEDGGFSYELTVT
jgi:hypothetical protein